jgi:hypothetical protein
VKYHLLPASLHNSWKQHHHHHAVGAPVPEFEQHHSKHLSTYFLAGMLLLPPNGFLAGVAATASSFLGFFAGLAETAMEAAATATFFCLAMAVKKTKTRNKMGGTGLESIHSQFGFGFSGWQRPNIKGKQMRCRIRSWLVVVVLINTTRVNLQSI